jgi:hypothetical protein
VSPELKPATENDSPEASQSFQKLWDKFLDDASRVPSRDEGGGTGLFQSTGVSLELGRVSGAGFFPML